MKPVTRPQNSDSILLKKGASSLQPDVWKIHGENGITVLKTFERSHPLLRDTLCKFMACREARNLEIMKDFPETPELVSQPDPCSIEMTYLPAEPVPEVKDELSIEYFDALHDFITRMHKRGLNHGDLRRKNLLILPETGLPAMVDFAQSLHRKTEDSIFDRVVMKRCIRVDIVTYLKLKKWYLGPEALTPEETETLNAKPWYLTLGRFLRKKVYRPYKHWRQGKKKKKK